MPIVIAMLSITLFTTPAQEPIAKCAGFTATIVGDAGDNTIGGTAMRDVIVAKGGNDTIFGRGGNDVICAGSGNDVVFGGDGGDLLMGGLGRDTMNGGLGNDILLGGRGNDTLNGNQNADTIKGGPNNDTIRGGPGIDRTLEGNAGADEILGGTGGDTLTGGTGNDVLKGGEGNDDLFGGPGADGLNGGMGTDRCFDGESHTGCAVETWAPFTISSSGDDIVNLKIPQNETAVLRFSYGAGSNFVVWSLNAALENIDLLVNEIGSYTGARPVNTGSLGDEPIRHIDVTASGPWTVEVEPLVLARSFSSGISGATDDVVVVNASGIADFTYSGSSNFIVWAYEADGDADLLVNEIGDFTGAAVIASGTAYLDVQGQGFWSITFR